MRVAAVLLPARVNLLLGEARGMRAESDLCWPASLRLFPLRLFFWVPWGGGVPKWVASGRRAFLWCQDSFNSPQRVHFILETYLLLTSPCSLYKTAFCLTLMCLKT